MAAQNIVADPVLLLARRASYRFAALALSDPQTGSWRELADPVSQAVIAQAAEILRDEPTAVVRPLALGERPLAELDPTPAFARLPKSEREWNEQYESAFGLLGGSKCPPYETEFVASKLTFQRSNMLADVAGFYHAFGFQVSTTHPDRPDHVTLQLEFMAQLLQLEWQARHSAGKEPGSRAEICYEAARRFLREHVAWWVPTFSRMLERQDPDGFYAEIAHFLAALVAVERALNGISASDQSAEPSSIEQPDECAGCELAMHNH
jgi:TorA maturation chaperone TorD